MRVLGLSAFYHDSAAALVVDGRIAAAAQEERFTRRKHEADYPQHAAAACLAQAGCELAEVERVVFYEKPFLKFERLLETYAAYAPRGFRSFILALPLWMKEKLFQKRLLQGRLHAQAPEVDWDARLLFAEHHQAHAASAFYPSPFREAAVLTLDGAGEWATTSAAVGRGLELEVLQELHFPHSLGLLYAAFTAYAGFRVNSGESKLMGLAPYGEAAYAQTILDHLIDLKPDGTFRLDMAYFDYCSGLRMTNGRFEALFGGPPRRPAEPLTRRHADLAASAQAVLEETVLRLTRSLRDATGLSSLCLAGGVALNCAANGAVLRDGRFEDVWIQPAAGDAGGALGAALLASHRLGGDPRRHLEAGGGSAAAGRAAAAGGGAAAAGGGAAAAGDRAPDGMRGALLGPGFGRAEIRAALEAAGARYQELDDDALIETAAQALAAGQTLGWHQGQMEFGPRALGARSILADARLPAMRAALNEAIKQREAFRPFAPSVPREDAAAWFELDRASPYMLLTAAVRPERRTAPPETEDAPDSLDGAPAPRSQIPAVTHVNDSARVQTVDREVDPRFHALLRAFEALTGCPVLLNTSFNVRGEPIVCTPADAFRCFMGAGLDCLAVGNCFLRRADQDAAPASANYADQFEPD